MIGNSPRRAIMTYPNMANGRLDYWEPLLVNILPSPLADIAITALEISSGKAGEAREEQRRCLLR